MHKNSHIVSVIIPVFKVEDYLEPCVRSVMGQTYRNLEIILVDDGSPDRCGIICDALAAEDDRIRVIHKANGGLSSARNAGLDAATGEYISFIDSDDLIDERFVELLLQQLLNDGSDMSVCGYRRLKPDGSDGAIHLLPSHEAVDERGYWCLDWKGDYFASIICCNKIFQRELWHDLRFPLGRVSEDALIINELVSRCERISFVQQALYTWRARDGSITSNFGFSRYYDAIEASLGRIEYYLDRGYEPTAKRCMMFCAKDLMSVYPHLKNASAGDAAKYLELREKYKALYRRYSDSYHPPREMRKCTLYAFSETAVLLYEQLRQWKKKLIH